VLEIQPDISCMDVMDALELLVTGANDSRIRLYEMRDNGLHLTKELDGHYKGIKGVSISIHHKLIVSCSFDFDILVWNAYLEHPVARLEGHEAPLMNVECPKKYQIIISMDSKSVMKIWSTENYQLLQNIVIF
jgi:WD40 repeat protein